MCNIRETLGKLLNEVTEQNDLKHLLDHGIELIAIIVAPYSNSTKTKCVMALVEAIQEESENYIAFKKNMDGAGIPPDAEITPAMKEQAMAFIQKARKAN